MTLDYVDIIASNYWPTSRKMFSETEGLLLPSQDQVLVKKNYLRYIAKDSLIQIPIWLPGNNSIPYWGLLNIGCYKIQSSKETTSRASEEPKTHPGKPVPFLRLHLPTIENNEYKLFWDRSVLSEQDVMHKRSDLILIDTNCRQLTVTQ